eukprot:Rhum_TRINITY_DN15333_c23_g1::Rhum_TRINITY_DN15333_c23_g1_i1::g.152542::m.152542
MQKLCGSNSILQGKGGEGGYVYVCGESRGTIHKKGKHHAIFPPSPRSSTTHQTKKHYPAPPTPRSLPSFSRLAFDKTRGEAERYSKSFSFFFGGEREQFEAVRSGLAARAWCGLVALLPLGPRPDEDPRHAEPRLVHRGDGAARRHAGAAVHDGVARRHTVEGPLAHLLQLLVAQRDAGRVVVRRERVVARRRDVPHLLVREARARLLRGAVTLRRACVQQAHAAVPRDGLDEGLVDRRLRRPLGHRKHNRLGGGGGGGVGVGGGGVDGQALLLPRGEAARQDGHVGVAGDAEHPPHAAGGGLAAHAVVRHDGVRGLQGVEGQPLLPVAEGRERVAARIGGHGSAELLQVEEASTLNARLGVLLLAQTQVLEAPPRVDEPRAAADARGGVLHRNKGLPRH